MPAFVGPLQIFNVGGGIVQFGDTGIISPKSNSKSATGAGSQSTGSFLITNSGFSTNTTFDNKLIDQPTVGNN